ncbi:hypothetical protein H4S07_001531 [Coemansia furcata]|uniref:Uncharacterized protein n=1 Tax=Coemansia furcata TaxID=417177 RepID=A0ACC1LN68_9FUNG|nr:hypothetical protein H4S07_001531 [Coemansia furcata]
MPPKKSTSSKKNKKKYQKQTRQDVALRAPVALASDILRLIIARVSPEPPYNCSRDKLLAHLHVMQRLAGISRQWRVVAKPLLYRVVVVDIDEVKYKIKARDVSGIKGVRTNIGLYVESGLVRIARDMLITVHGLSQIVDQYSHILQHTGFAKTVWPGIERLRYDISGSKISFNSSMFTNARGVDMATLNRILSMSLPCLREIQALGIRGENYVMGAPVSFLIDECL